MTDRVSIDGWFDGLPATDEAAVRELVRRVREVDRRGPTDIDDLGPGAAVMLARIDGVPVGVSWRHDDHPAELLVHPDFRRRGVGTALAGRLLGEGRGIWAHAALPAAVALAARLGVIGVRELLQLRRSPIGTWPVAVPDGVRLRPFVIGRDEEQFLGVNARAFAWHPEQGRLDLAGLRADEGLDWFDPAGFFLAVDEGDRVLGFHWTKIHPQDPTPPPDRSTSGRPGSPGPVGEVYVLGVDPTSPVRALGAPLTAAGLNHLADRGLETVMLYVESDNEPARKLYRRFGFDHFQSDIVYARPPVAG